MIVFSFIFLSVGGGGGGVTVGSVLVLAYKYGLITYIIIR